MTTGGSGGAVFHIEAPEEGGLAAVSMTDTDEVTASDGVEIGIHDINGTNVAWVQPNFQSTDPAVNDVYYVTVTPQGYLYKPISASFPSARAGSTWIATCGFSDSRWEAGTLFPPPGNRATNAGTTFCNRVSARQHFRRWFKAITCAVIPTSSMAEPWHRTSRFGAGSWPRPIAR